MSDQKTLKFGVTDALLGESGEEAEQAPKHPVPEPGPARPVAPPMPIAVNPSPAQLLAIRVEAEEAAEGEDE